MKEIIKLGLRHIATAGAGYLVKADLIGQTDVDQFVALALFVAGIAWSIYDKYVAKKKLRAAELAPAIRA